MKFVFENDKQIFHWQINTKPAIYRKIFEYIKTENRSCDYLFSYLTCGARSFSGGLLCKLTMSTGTIGFTLEIVHDRD